MFFGQNNDQEFHALFKIVKRFPKNECRRSKKTTFSHILDSLFYLFFTSVQQVYINL